jgi:hypothetical protein
LVEGLKFSVRTAVIVLWILILFSCPSLAYNCWSWGEPSFCGQFPPDFVQIAQDVKKCMSENHLALQLPILVILKANYFYCVDGEPCQGETIFPYSIVIADTQDIALNFQILRHELVHYILWAAGHPQGTEYGYHIANHDDWQFFSGKCIYRTTPYEREMIDQEQAALKGESEEEPSYALSPETPYSPETSEKSSPSSSVPKGEIYKWVDRNGTLYSTNDTNSIPQEYIDKLSK